MNAVAVPWRSTEQRAAALRRGNEVRLLRAGMKRSLTLPVCLDLVAQPPWWLASMKIEPLLVAVPKFGPVGVRALLRRLLIAESKTVGGLSWRQRNALLDALRERAC